MQNSEGDGGAHPRVTHFRGTIVSPNAGIRGQKAWVEPAYKHFLRHNGEYGERGNSI